VPQDYDEASVWFGKAAEQEKADAMHHTRMKAMQKRKEIKNLLKRPKKMGKTTLTNPGMAQSPAEDVDLPRL
jgi:TPR repeat protein